MADGATAGRPVTCVQVAPPSLVSSSRLLAVRVPTHPRRSEAKATQRRYRPSAWNCSCQVTPPSSVRMIWPLLFTSQPSSGFWNQMSSVRELAWGAPVGRQVGGGGSPPFICARPPPGEWPG